MCPSKIHRFARTAAAIALTAAAASSQAAIGMKLIIQGWEPWNDNAQPTVVPINSPGLISDPLQRAWEPMRQELCRRAAALLGRQDMIHAGVSLYNISCQLNPLDIAIVPVSNNRARFVIALKGSRIAATSTTPNAAQLGADLPLVGGVGLPGAVDPRFSVTLDAQLEFDIEIGDAPQPLFTVRSARLDVKRADARGENITGKLAEWVASKVIPFFGGPNFERMAEGMLESLGANFTAQAQNAMNEVNARVAPYAQYVRVGTWFSSNRIAIALQPRNLPIFRFDGEIRGAMLPTGPLFGSVSGASLCNGFRVAAEYQKSPRPILDPDRMELGAPPMAPVGVFSGGQPQADGSCAYSIRGLALGVTNYVSASHPIAGVQTRLFKTKLTSPGWDGRRVNPRPLETARNFAIDATQTPLANAELDPRRTVVDRRVNYGRLALSRSPDVLGRSPEVNTTQVLTAGNRSRLTIGSANPAVNAARLSVLR